MQLVLSEWQFCPFNRMSGFDRVPEDASVLRGLFVSLELKEILRLSITSRSCRRHCYSWLQQNPCKWLQKAVAAASVPAVNQMLERLPCKHLVLQLMLPRLLRIPNIPGAVVELLVQNGAVPSENELLAAVEEGVPGLVVWPRACKAKEVPTQLSPLAEAIWCNTELPVGGWHLTPLQDAKCSN